MRSLLLSLLLAAAEPSTASIGARMAEAAKTGDVHKMEALKGEGFQQRVEVVRLWRDGHVYRDALVRARREPGGEPFELLVRIPVKLSAEKLPASLFVRGNVNDFEPVPVERKLTWLPCVLAAEIR